MTLVELMVSMFLFGILSGAAYLSLEVGKRSGRVGEVEVELQQHARQAMAEMLKEFRESRSATVTIYPTSTTYYQDPQTNNEWHQAIAFASARGDSGATQEGTCPDEVTNNACFHVDSTGNPRWRALIVYAPYQTSDGRMELRRYVNYNTAWGGPSLHFPFTFTSITTTQLRLQSASGTNVTFNRDGSGGTEMRVLAENVLTEDADNDNNLDTIENDGSANLPFDNADGILNHGTDYSLNGRVLTTTLFLRKRDVPFATAGRFMVLTLKSSVEMRN